MVVPNFLLTFAEQINGYEKTMAEQEKWKWQEPGTTWKGIGQKVKKRGKWMNEI